MIVLDTTVLVYAKGSDHLLREPCRELVQAIATGQLRATASIEVIQEFAHVRARRTSRTDAAALARDYADLLSPLITVSGEDLRRGLSLFEQVEELRAFDAVLAAAALETQARQLVSADRAFAGVPDLAHVFPDAEGVRQITV